MCRPAAGGGDVHIVEPPGKRHRLSVHGVHAPFRMRLKGVLCRGIDRAVGQRPDAAGLAGFYLPCDDAQIRWAPHRIVVPFTRRQKPVVPVHPVVKLHCIEMQITHPLHVRRVRVERGEVRQKSVADLRAAVRNNIERALPNAFRGADAHTVAAGRHIRQDQSIALPDGMEKNLTLHAEERHRRRCGILRQDQPYRLAGEILRFVKVTGDLLHSFILSRPPASARRRPFSAEKSQTERSRGSAPGSTRQKPTPTASHIARSAAAAAAGR